MLAEGDLALSAALFQFALSPELWLVKAVLAFAAVCTNACFTDPTSLPLHPYVITIAEVQYVSMCMLDNV